MVNRDSAIEVLRKCFCAVENSDFDKNRILTNEKNIGFVNIYYASDFEYEIYSDDDIDEIDIKINQ